jgi:hypothetical protein
VEGHSSKRHALQTLVEQSCSTQGSLTSDGPLMSKSARLDQQSWLPKTFWSGCGTELSNSHLLIFVNSRGQSGRGSTDGRPPIATQFAFIS